MGGAAVRNRAKRMVREAFRLSMAELPPLDLVVADFSLSDYARKEHHELLRRTLEKFPETFVWQADYPIQRENIWTNKIAVYRVKK